MLCYLFLCRLSSLDVNALLPRGLPVAKVARGQEFVMSSRGLSVHTLSSSSNSNSGSVRTTHTTCITQTRTSHCTLSCKCTHTIMQIPLVRSQVILSCLSGLLGSFCAVHAVVSRSSFLRAFARHGRSLSDIHGSTSHITCNIATTHAPGVEFICTTPRLRQRDSDSEKVRQESETAIESECCYLGAFSTSCRSAYETFHKLPDMGARRIRIARFGALIPLVVLLSFNTFGSLFFLDL